jgi:hypothetical protein
MTSDHAGGDNLAQALARVLEKNLGVLLQTAGMGLHHGRRLAHTDGSLSRLPRNLRVSDLPGEYERINATAIARKSPEQLRKWRVARATSVDTFIGALGSDCLVRELTIHHAHILHHYWQQRALSGEVRINSANRLMRNISGLYSAIHNYYRLEHPNPFAGLNLRGGREGKRLAFSAAFVRSHLLADGALETLNHRNGASSFGGLRARPINDQSWRHNPVCPCD